MRTYATAGRAPCTRHASPPGVGSRWDPQQALLLPLRCRSIEGPHAHLKRRLDQALRRRGSRDFVSIEAWREGLVGLLRHALPDQPETDLAALADHVFVTFEGAFILCRATGDATHMRGQLRALRLMVEALLRSPTA